jgi:hypothetical protein
VSRALVAAGGAPVNAKRVYRIMKAQRWPEPVNENETAVVRVQ